MKLCPTPKSAYRIRSTRKDALPSMLGVEPDTGEPHARDHAARREGPRLDHGGSRRHWRYILLGAPKSPEFFSLTIGAVFSTTHQQGLV